MKDLFKPMWKAVIFSVAGLTILGLFACDNPDSNDWSGYEDEVTIVAHRGAMAERPENTMSAFARAVELGADIVELDIWTSRDGELFLLHDQTLDRTTDGDGDARELTLEELQELDAGSWFDSQYEDEHIPSFREALEWARDEDIVLLLDLKESGQEYANAVASEVQSAGTEENMVVGVRSPDQARKFAELLPNARLLAFMGSPDEIQDYAEAGVDVIRLWLRWVEDDPALVEQVTETGAKLMINGTEGELEEARALMSYDPDWILIDDIVQLQGSLEEIESEQEASR